MSALKAASKLLQSRTSSVQNDVIRLYSAKPRLPFGNDISGKYFTCDVKNDVAILAFNNPKAPVNTFSMPLMNEVIKTFREIETVNEIKGVVLCSQKNGCFFAGADLEMVAFYDKIPEIEDSLNICEEMTNDIENCVKPVVCAINGICLGGGLEMALASHYRIALNLKSVEFGLPEVGLGILPGGGGTQRLPRYAGLLKSLDLMISGRSFKIGEALQLGVIDEVIQAIGPGTKDGSTRSNEHLQAIAIKMALDLANGKKKLNRPRRLVNLPPNFALKPDQIKIKDKIFDEYKNKVLIATQGKYPAPPRIVDVVRLGQDKGFRRGLGAECLAFTELNLTPTAKGLFAVFFMRSALKRNKFAKEPFKPVKKLGVLGAGTMGSGITQVSDKFSCILKDSSEDGLVRGYKQVSGSILKRVRNNKITSLEGDKLISNVSYQLDYKGFDKCDLVIESVFEDLVLKKKILQEVEDIIPENCIYATNTSALSVTKIAEASKRPENVIGMHYFSPVDQMQLCEIIVTDKTSKATIASAIDVALKQGKYIIVVKDGPGFYTTRILSCMMGEAMRLLQEGVSPLLIDKVTTEFGFPVGFCTLADEVGLDGMGNIYKLLSQSLGERFISGSSELIDEAVAAGNRGRKKDGKGIYIYQEGAKGDKPLNSQVFDIIHKYQIRPKGTLTTDDILFRILTRSVNEAVMCLEEGIISSPMDGDGGAIFAIGFPGYTGGPFKYLDVFGADKLVEKMKVFEQDYGASYTPCKTLQEYAENTSKKFYGAIPTK